MEGFGGSVAGGGRYDKLIGEIYRRRYTGVRTFPSAFERIITILMVMPVSKYRRQPARKHSCMRKV